MSAAVHVGSRRARFAVGIAVAMVLTFLPGAGAQRPARAQSPLWGDLTPGPHRVGFAVEKLRDRTRSAAPRSVQGSPADRGYPLVLRYWYPATPGADAAPMTFARYHAADVVDQELADPTRERLAAADRDLKAFYERPFNFPFGAVEADRWSRLGPTPLTAVMGAPAAPGRFPLVVGVGGAQGNAVLGEYLASHGYVVGIISSPADVELTPAARMEWYVRDLEFGLARMRELPHADGHRAATWGFSFAGMPALLAGIRAPGVDAVVSLESGIFAEPYAQQLRANPFFAPANLRVPFMHMMRTSLSRADERLSDIEALRYSERVRYLLDDTLLVHQDFGTHGMAAAAVLGKRPAALGAAKRAQLANALYVRHFLDAHVKGSASAAAWLARAPEENGIGPATLTLVRLPARRPAPSAREFVAMATRDGIRHALERFHTARQADPEAALFQEATVNGIGYQLLRGGRVADAIEVFTTNVELYPRSANVYDSLSEAYEAAGDSARAIEFARKTVDALPGDTTLTGAGRENFRRVAGERIRRLDRP